MNKSILRQALIEHAVSSNDTKMLKQLRHQQRVYRAQRTRKSERRMFASVKAQPSWRMADQNHQPSVAWCENVNPKAGGTLNPDPYTRKHWSKFIK